MEPTSASSNINRVESSINNFHDALPAHLNKKLTRHYRVRMSRFTDLLLLEVWSIVFVFTLSITNPLFRIGRGATPIAARESVVRYHMALRETAYTDKSQFSIFL